MQRLAVVCVPLMALVGATTWTMYLSRRRGTMHSLERWRALAARLGYPKHATKIARSRPLRLVCHSFTSSIYLPILAKRRNILIGYVYESFPRANRIISLDPYVAIHSNKELLPLLCPTSTHVSHEYFLSCWNRIGACSGGISPFDLSASESPFGRR